MQSPTKPNIVWQVLSAGKLKSDSNQGKRVSTACTAASVGQQTATEGKQSATGSSSRQCAAEMQGVKAITRQHTMPGVGAPGAAVWCPTHRKRSASAMLEEQASPPDATATACVKPPGANARVPFQQPGFVQSLHRRTVVKKPKRKGVTQPTEACHAADQQYRSTRMSIVEGRPCTDDANLPPDKKART